MSPGRVSGVFPGLCLETLIRRSPQRAGRLRRGKKSVPGLIKLAKFIYKNLPFVEHIAFMGLENQGYTPYNIEKLWIDPVDYMYDLTEAAEYLSSRGLNVSIYNSQLCIMPKEMWKYNKKSISDWKNIYLDECLNCSIIDKCGGLFASCEKMHSKYIYRINEPSFEV